MPYAHAICCCNEHPFQVFLVIDNCLLHPKYLCDLHPNVEVIFGLQRLHRWLSLLTKKKTPISSLSITHSSFISNIPPQRAMLRFTIFLKKMIFSFHLCFQLICQHFKTVHQFGVAFLWRIPLRIWWQYGTLVTPTTILHRYKNLIPISVLRDYCSQPRFML